MKSCPFCGSVNIGDTVGEIGKDIGVYAKFYISVICKDCGGSIEGVGNTIKEALANAEEKWNTRPEVCANCKYLVTINEPDSVEFEGDNG